MKLQSIPSWLYSYGFPLSLIRPEMKKGLIGMWLPHVGYGANVALDVSGYGHHGSLIGGIIIYKEEIGPGWWFTGGRIAIGDYSLLEPSEITLLSIIRTSDDDTRIMAKYLVANPWSGYALGIFSGKLSMWTGDLVASWLFGATPITDNKYHVVAGTFRNGTQTVFLDGKQDGQQPATPVFNSTASLTLAAMHDGTASYRHYMGPCGIWNRALEPSEILRLSFNFWDTMFQKPTQFLKAFALPGATIIRLNWIDNSEHEDGFSIERKTDAGAFGEIDTVAADIETYDNVNVPEGHTYTYRVKATDTSLGDSEYSNEASEVV